MYWLRWESPGLVFISSGGGGGGSCPVEVMSSVERPAAQAVRRGRVPVMISGRVTVGLRSLTQFRLYGEPSRRLALDFAMR